MPKPYVRDLYWLPKSMVNMNAVNTYFTVDFTEDMDTPVTLEMYKLKTRKGKPWIGLPRGDRSRVKKCLRNPRDIWKIKDRRTDAPVDFSKLKFLGKFNPGQLRAARIMAKTENGVLKSAPRTGKCLDGETLIATSHGLMRIKKFPKGPMIKVENDIEYWYEPRSEIYVASKDGPRRVTAFYESVAQVFRLDTSSGHSLTATADERVMVENKGWVKLIDLQPGDKLQTGQIPLWRRNGRTYPEVGEAFKKFIGDRITPPFATLLAYWTRITPVKGQGPRQFELNSSSAVVNHARKLIKDITGVPHVHDVHLTIPQWLSSALKAFGSTNYVPDSIKVANSFCVTAYLKGLFECSGFRRWQADTDFRLIWTLPSQQMAEGVRNIMDNYGIQLMRSNNRVYGDSYNSARFIKTLGIKGIEVRDDLNPTVPACVVLSVTPVGKQPVYDLSVGEDEDTHNFVANGLLVHNTVMGTEALIRAGQKTLIMAHQTDLIEQFCYETILDEDEELFNGNRFKTPPAALCYTYEDFKKYPICLSTYQAFLSPKGQKMLHRIKDMFGTVMIDEVHRAPADRYSQILSKMSARNMWGLTATDDRKDGLYVVTEMIIGPVAHRVNAKALSARVYAMETGIKHRKPPSTWNGQISFLFKSKERNQLIARTAVADMKRGHTVLIPVIHHEHAAAIRAEIIKITGDKRSVFTFTGLIAKKDRKWARHVMRSDPHAKIHIANRSMLTGVNVPRWSAIYTVVPITNPPLYEQEVQRICTVMEGKKHPIVRYFFDECLPSSARRIKICAKTLADPQLGHEITESFHRLNNSKAAVKRGGSIDDFQKVRTISKTGPIKRF